MSNSKDIDDYANLKTLLISWRLQYLFEHLRDEDINIEELQMMKRHHINELLNNFKLGTRIRFEHNLEKWRRIIDKPLDVYTRACVANKPNLTATTQPDLTNSNSKPSTVPTTLKIQSVTSNHRPSSTVLSNEVPKMNVFPQPQSAQSTQSLQSTMMPFQIPTSTEPNAIRTNKSFSEKGKTVITVHKILQNAGQKGLSLLEFYDKYKFFTDFQRQLLIQLIVYYFHVNEYHLSLHASYILEKQIIKLFPTEKLDYYRSGKRGKIYIKFCNMKRKREDPPISPTGLSRLPELPIESTETEILPKNDNFDTDGTNDGHEMDFTMENSIDADNIKTEYLSE